MNYNIILMLLINIKLYLARDYDLSCMYTNFEAGAYIHCNPRKQTSYGLEYDKCETKSAPNLEYYQCIYKIHQIPTEQVILLSKLHHATLKCKDCEYTRNWKFKNPKFCTNKAEAEYYKTYSDCLLNYINVNEKELENNERCVQMCYISIEILSYSKCVYDCYKDVTKKIVESEPKVTTFVNNIQINENNTDRDKKSSALLNFDCLSIYSAITLSLIAALVIS